LGALSHRFYGWAGSRISRFDGPGWEKDADTKKLQPEPTGLIQSIIRSAAMTTRLTLKALIPGWAYHEAPRPLGSRSPAAARGAAGAGSINKQQIYFSIRLDW
jgi:hypothetical protein